MTTQIPAPTRSVGANGYPLATPPPNSIAGSRLPTVRRPRRPALAAAGALLVLLCGITSAALASAGHDRLKVLALARDVQAGQVLSGDDLRIAELSGTGLQAIAATGASAALGQTLTASMPAGTLLNASMLTPAPVPATGQQLVAVAVKPGGVPEQAAPGRDVSLIQVVSTSGVAGSGPGVLVARARLLSIHADAASGLQVLSVQVPQSSALAVAQASAAGAIVVTLLPVAP
jgi:hypothetical protein